MRKPRLRSKAGPASPSAGRPGWPGLAVLLALVCIGKLALALTLADHPLLQPVGELDAGEYWRLAARVAGGDLLLQGTPSYLSPLYVYWLALAMTISGGSVAGVLVLQAGVGTAAVWLAARAAAAWVGASSQARAAIVAGGSLALTSIVALQEALILQSALDAFLMAAFALAFTRAAIDGSPRTWAWCGAALALLATNRPNAWLLALVCLPAAAFTVARVVRARAVVAWSLGAVLVVAPFTLRAALATGEWTALPGHGGLNAYIGNHAEANGTYTVLPGIRPSMEGQRQDAQLVASRAEGRTVRPSEVSAHFARRALDWWRQSPWQATRLLAYKIWLSTHSWELPVNVSHAWFREQVPLLWILPVGAWLLVPAGLAASVGGHLAVASDRIAPWHWFRVLLPVYLLGVAIFFVVDRYRAPALVLGAIHLGVLAAMRGESRQRDAGRGALAAMGLAVVVFVGGLVPLPFQRGEADADAQMAFHAIAEGSDTEADRWLARAVARHPAPGIVWFRAGLGWQSRSELARAERALREAHRLDPDVSEATFALAGVLLSQGKGAEALPLLRRLDAQGERGVPTAGGGRLRLDIALAHWQAGDQALARGVLDSGVTPDALPLLRARALAAVEARRVDLAEWLLSVCRQHAPGDAEVAEKLGLMRARMGRVDEAAALLEDAARLDPQRATARFNLAVLRAQQGRSEQAIALLRDALRIDPSYEQAAGALRELLHGS